MYDITIIGSGITGSFIARELSRYNLKIALLEKENDVANGTTMANSAIVHSGYDPKPGSNKAKFNVKGNALYEKICQDLDVPFKKIGSLTVAVDDEEVETLKTLKERSDINGVPVTLLSREEVLKREPNLSDEVKAALYAPTAGIVGPWELAIALMENAVDNGVELKLDTEVQGIEKEDMDYNISTNHGDYQSKIVINCAGVHADDINRMVNKDSFDIRPRRGQYFVLDKGVGNLINSVIFPCPSKAGKGVLVAPTVHGNVLLGPTSKFIDDKAGIETTEEGLTYIRERVGHLLKDVPYHKVIRSFSGLRATSDVGDFIIEVSEKSNGFINVAGIESPGLASAPAIANEVVDLVQGIHGELEAKEDFNPRRKEVIRFHDLSVKDKSKIIQQDPKYGNVICRCETITEGEIIDCIHRSAGATTVKGVKKRVRPGMGRCQGGFCEPRVVEILARELKKDMEEVVYDHVDSKILVGQTKE